jgi:hypothetical protein
MPRKRFKRVTICLTEPEYEQFRRVAGIRKESVSQFIRYLMSIYLKANKSVVDLMEMLEKNSIDKPS